MTATLPTSSGNRPVSIPTPEEIDTIVAIADPALRNLHITYAYHRLAMALPLQRPGANWCAFAVWASKQAGQTIRGEDLMRALERSLRNDRELATVMSGGLRWAIRNALEAPGTRRWRVLQVLGQEAFARAADALARGNRKVFGEIGREFARFLPLCASIPISDQTLEGFLSSVPQDGFSSSPNRLRDAFAHYAGALAEADSKASAELVLLANLEIAFHEQARVQPEIMEALEVPYTTFTELGRRLLAAIFPSSPGWFPFARTPVAVLLGAGGRIAEAALRALLRRLITESMLTLTLPEGVLKLGRPLPGDPPEYLREPMHPELRALLAQLAPAGWDLDGSGADDWSLLTERMTSIGSLFHRRHGDDALYNAPFTPAQVEAFLAGRLPDGAL